jgi:hypothetical protein
METRMKKILAGLAVGTTLAALGACMLPAGDGEGLTADRVDTSGTVQAPPDTNLTFVVNTILKPKCQACHGTNPPGGAVVFSSVAEARNTLFDNGNPRVSTESPSTHPIYRVKPGSPDSSYLYEKLVSATPKSGVRMPQGGPYLSDAQITVIRRWIQKGAPQQ